MDLSALIFVALAVAWAVYLIPKALKHHEDVAGSRPVDGFSDRLRVLARREPVDRRTSRLVVTPGRPASTAVPLPEPEPAPAARLTAGQVRAHRASAARAARRRLRVVAVILLTHVVVAVLAVVGVVAWAYLTIPAATLVVWLVLCRLMVTRERAVLAPRASGSTAAEAAAPAAEPAVEPEVEQPDVEDGPVTEEIAVTSPASEAPAPAEQVAPGGWDLVPVTLPTYVGKEPAARRSVRTIDLDSTGVWTSGRSAVDSAIAREADEAAKASRADVQDAEAAKRRAAGS